PACISGCSIGLPMSFANRSPVTNIRPDTRSYIDAGCRILEWDSDFFGHRIARIDSSHVAAGGMHAAEEWCTSQGIECAYLLVDADDHLTSDLAQAHGFRLVDVRVTLESVTPGSTALPLRTDGPQVRVARAGDLERLEEIAGESHHDTRFYVDGRFDPRRCDDLYRLWIAKSCRGWADIVFVAEIDCSAVGYLTCHLHDRTGRIGLVAGSPSSRGRGAGASLVGAAQCWFREQHVDRVSVVTQGRNPASLRLYQRAGMIVTALQLWFHKWW